MIAFLALLAGNPSVLAAGGQPVLHASCVQNRVTLQSLNSPWIAGTAYSPSELNEWLPSPKGGRTRGVVLMIHGLNLRPSRMDALGGALGNLGFDVLRVALSGHRGSLEEMKNVTREEWLIEAYSSYCLALARAREKRVPLFTVGYSLGALVIEDLMNFKTPDPVLFKSAVMLSPAVAIRARSNLIRVLGIFGRGFVVPSASPTEYRANPGTTMAAYESLFDMADELERSRLSRSNIPTLVMIDPRDELVSFGGVREMIRNFALDRWRVVPVTGRIFHHLIIDSNAVGPAQWGAMLAEIRRQFTGSDSRERDSVKRDSRSPAPDPR